MGTQHLNEETWIPGRHYIGVGHKFIRFNSTVSTVQFSHGRGKDVSGGALQSRTTDGLEVLLEISFQYRLLPKTLYKMYTTFGSTYHLVLVKMSIDLLTVAATKHEARAFFENRTVIGDEMEATLRSHFLEHAFVDVPLFQFQAVSLPGSFEDSIKATQVAEQKITRIQAEQVMRRVEFETNVIQAQRYVKVREQEAEAVVQSIMLRNQADIASFNASQIRSAQAFVEILNLFNGDAQQLLAYMKVRAMRNHPQEHTVLGIKDTVDVTHANTVV